MRRGGPIAAIAVLVVSNVWLLAHVATNRAGQPEAQIELTSRELSYRGGGPEESAVTLALRWQNPAPEYAVAPLDTVGWFDERKLAEVGFDLGLSVDSPDAPRYYGTQRSRTLYVALEFDGPSWQQWLAWREQQFRLESAIAGQSLTIDQRLQVERESESRLVAVDAAVDPRALRRAHPDRQHVLILAARARVAFDAATSVFAGRPARPHGIRGAIAQILTDQINVPQPHSRVLAGRSTDMPWRIENGVLTIPPPRYAVTLAVGSRYEPWVVDAKPLGPAIGQ